MIDGVMASWRRLIEPLARSTAARAASVVDRAVVAAMHARGARDRARAETLGHHERLEILGAIQKAYGDESLFDAEKGFFPVPPSIDVTLKRVRDGVWDAAWPSTFEPYLAAVADRYL